MSSFYRVSRIQNSSGGNKRRYIILCCLLVGYFAQFNRADSKTPKADGAESSSPISSDLYFVRANQEAANGNIASATRDFTSAITQNPKFYAAYIQRGQLRVGSGDQNGAIEDFTAAGRLRPNSPEPQALRGVAHQNSGELALARIDYDAAIKSDPNYWLARYYRCSLLLGTRDPSFFSLARADADQCVKIAPQLAASYCLRSMAELAVQDTAAANTDATKAFRLEPKNLDAIFVMGGVAIARKDFATATKYFDAGIAAAGPKSIDAFRFYSGRGQTKHALKDFAGSISDYSLALQILPENPDILILRAVDYRDSNDATRALADLDQALRSNPGDNSTKLQRLYTIYLSGDYNRTIAECSAIINQKSVAEVPPQILAAALTQRAWAYQKLGQYEFAIADRTAAMAKEPDPRSNLASRAHEEFALGRYSAAITDYNRIISNNPELHPYEVFFRTILLRRLQDPNANVMLRTAASRIQGRWPQFVAAYLLGKIDEQQFINLSREGDQSAQLGQQCEAYFYLGITNVARGNGREAKECFERALASKQFTYTEYMLSKAELARLGRPDGVTSWQ